ncbi:MAG: hypothetical protein KJO18_05975 [Acidimicrobiia bacterium]|nr:hypothetical protein [Acidimicrobiia bacterium]
MSATRLRGLVASTVVVLLLSSCSAARPSWEVWDLTWATAQSAVPSASALVASGESGLCDSGLAQLRSIRSDLVPTPEPLLDETMNDWIETAEGALFACPPVNDESYEAAFAELDQLEAAIESLIAGR